MIYFWYISLFLIKKDQGKHIENILKPIKVFCSCSDSRKDALLLKRLEAQLSILQREGLISIWHRGRFAAGTSQQAELDYHLNTASLILLLISSDFLDSDVTYGSEMQCALQRYKARKTHVIPILLSPCYWQNAPFAVLDVLPSNAKPVTKWRDREDAWTDVVMGIRRVLGEELQAEAHDGPIIFPRDNVNSGQSLSLSPNKNRGETRTKESSASYSAQERDGIHSLKEGSEALWNGNYSTAKKELRRAVEEIARKQQPQEVSRAHCFLAIALLEGTLPRMQGRAIMQAIESLMESAIKIYPHASYYRILASIKKDFFEYNGFDYRLEEVYDLEYKGASLPRQKDDDMCEDYLRHCQPRLLF